jgi:hypothetical protein
MALPLAIVLPFADWNVDATNSVKAVLSMGVTVRRLGSPK